MANVRLRLLNRNGNLHPPSFTVTSQISESVLARMKIVDYAVEIYLFHY